MTTSTIIAGQRNRTACQTPIASPRFCIVYLVGGKERATPWLHSRERAALALEIVRRKYDANAVIYRD